MFVTRQNGVIKLKLVSSVDKSIKTLQLVLVSFPQGGSDAGGLQASCRGLGAAPWVPAQWGTSDGASWTEIRGEGRRFALRPPSI